MPKKVKELEGVVRVRAKFLDDDTYRKRTRTSQVKQETLGKSKLLVGENRLKFRQDALMGVSYTANKWNIKPETVREIVKKNFRDLNITLLRP